MFNFRLFCDIFLLFVEHVVSTLLSTLQKSHNGIPWISMEHL